MDQTYKQLLTDGTSRLVKEYNYYIIGQGARDGGHGMSATIDGSLKENCIELPVFNEPGG